MGEEIGHECGFALLRLLKPPEYYLQKYGTHFFGLNRMYLIMEKQRNRGQDGAGVANVKLDVPPGTKYISCQKSNAADPIKDVFQLANQQAAEKLQKAPKAARSSDCDNSTEQIDPKWVKENVPFSGEVLLAHVRYGTDSENNVEKCHPVLRQSNWMTRNLVLAGNFNITNNEELFSSLVQLGQHPLELSDTVTLLEKIGHFVDKENNDLYVKYSAAGHDPRTSFSLIAENINIARILRRASGDWDGGYCIAGMLGHGDAFVMRDPSGIRPAFYYADEELIVVASEKPLIQTVFRAPDEAVNPIPPGQAICIKRSGAWTLEKILEPLAFKQCSFERIYFSRGNDASVYREREQLGRLLLNPLLKILGDTGDSLSNAVLSFIPNTSELAYYGLVKEAQDHLDRHKQHVVQELLSRGANPTGVGAELQKLFSATVRMEKVVHKDAKIRTFIQDDSSREHLTMHAYDLHYGTVRSGQDVIVALDDSIVRGNTLKNAILRTLDRMQPTRIIVLSSCPQIRFPDVYGIDMAKLGDLAAFKAAIALLRERGMQYIITDVYNQCKKEVTLPLKGREIVNHMKRIYAPFTAEEISQRIAKDVKPDDCKADVQVVYQTIDDLHKALPEHAGDWYFSGDYPTQGGARVCCRAFVLWMEGSSQRCYGVNSALSGTRNNVLILGSGGRAHALAWKLSKSMDVGCVYVAPGNGGMGQFDTSNTGFNTAPIIPVDIKVQAPHFEDIVVFCKQKVIQLVVVGPAQHLADGLGDELQKRHIPVFGPSKLAAQIESSKVFAKHLMKKCNVPTAEYACFKGSAQIEDALRYLQQSPSDIVVKASGLTHHKHVVVPNDKAEAAKSIRDCLEHNAFGSAGNEIVLEEKLDGIECSVLALTDGSHIAVLPVAQGYKPALDGDQGPNTGGMGAFAPTPNVQPKMLESIQHEILEPIIEGLKSEGCPFVGCLFARVMLTDCGPKVIGFNCRFGDPETQAILPLLDCDLYATLLSCVQGRLSENPVKVLPKQSAVSIVLASGGYPGSYHEGHKISGLERARCVPGVTIFHAGTQPLGSQVHLQSGEGPLSHAIMRGPTKQDIVTSGGRVLAVTALGGALTEARERAYVAARSIQFTGAFYRKDIGSSNMGAEDRKLTKKSSCMEESNAKYLAVGVDQHMHEAIAAQIVPMMQQTDRNGSHGLVQSANGLGGICSPALANYQEPVLVSRTNSVGTKTKVAASMQKSESIGQDLVALCVNDIVACGAEPLYFVCHMATSKLDAQQALQVVSGVTDGCTEAQCLLMGANTSELPGVFRSNDYDTVGFAAGVAERSNLLPRKESMIDGDVMIGLASSGLHSNGFSLVRSVAEGAGVSYHAAAPFDPTQSLGEAFLTPTRIYARPVLKLAKAGKLKGAAPIASGGLERGISRILPAHLQAQLQADSWELPAVFRWIAGTFDISSSEMASTFNCGIGMVLVLAKADVADCLQVLRDLHEEPVVLGSLAERSEGGQAVLVEGAESAWMMLPELGVSMPFPQVLSSLHEPYAMSRARVLILGGSATVSPLRAILGTTAAAAFPAQVMAVASTDPIGHILGLGQASGIETVSLVSTSTAMSDMSLPSCVTENLDSLAKEKQIDLLVLLDDFDVSLITPEFRAKWKAKCLVLEASLFPMKASTRCEVVQQVLDQNMLVAGCTVRKFGDGDDWGPIVAQESTRVLPGDSKAALHARIVSECEVKAVEDAMREFAAKAHFVAPPKRSHHEADFGCAFVPPVQGSGSGELQSPSAEKRRRLHAETCNVLSGTCSKIVPDSLSGGAITLKA